MEGEATMQASSLTEEMRKEILPRLKKIEDRRVESGGWWKKTVIVPIFSSRFRPFPLQPEDWGWSSWRGECQIVPLQYQACVTRHMWRRR